MVSGFSHSTGTPASRQALTCSSCAAPGLAISTASTSGSLIAAIGSSTTRAPTDARDLGRLVGEEVVDHRHPRSADPLAQRVDVEGAHHADAEHRDAQRLSHPRLPKSTVAPLQELR